MENNNNVGSWITVCTWILGNMKVTKDQAARMHLASYIEVSHELNKDFQNINKKNYKCIHNQETGSYMISSIIDYNRKRSSDDGSGNTEKKSRI